MAEPAPDRAPHAEEPGGPPALPLVRVVSFWGFGALVVLAVAFVLWWGLSFGVWADNGVYAVAITLLGFGLAGLWLMTPNPPVSATERPAVPPTRR